MNEREMNTINKPLSVIKDEFVENLINLINGNGIPLFVTEYILKDILTEISTAVKEQAKMEKAQYEQMLKQQIQQIEAEKKSENAGEDKK